MYRLKEWYLEASAHGVRGHGRCYGNPKFYSGEFVTTSTVVRAEMAEEEGQLKLFTKSGSCYVLGYADINDFQTECTQEALKAMDAAVDLQRCAALKEERLEATKKKLEEVLKPNELYVVMTGGQGVSEAYFKREDGIVVPISIRNHIGMFQDSIIIADWKEGLCDWRIFPSAFSVQPYHWSDHLKAVHLENVGEDFVFVGSAREIECKSGAVTVIKSEEYVGEGLFSPDAVNGKCLFSADFPDDLGSGR